MKENNVILTDAPQCSLEFLSLLKHTGIPPHHLQLKKGAVCCLMRNMSVRHNLVKNARVVIEQLGRRFIQIRVINNRTGRLGDLQCLPRICFEFAPHQASWTVHRIQFPLRLAYATTFHGCAGLTLDRVVLDLRTTVFTYGQLYTALSRVRKRGDCQVMFREDQENSVTTNIVYKELLLH